MGRYTIVESTPNGIETVNRYEDLERHHPSSPELPSREFDTINGRREEVKFRDREEIVKDFVLLQNGSDRNVSVPSPFPTSYAHPTGDGTNSVFFYDKPFGTPGAQRLGAVLHMEPGTEPKEGQKIEYGQPIGIQGDRGSEPAIHVHLQADLATLKKYISDVAEGRIQSGGVVTATPPTGTSAPSPDSGTLKDKLLEKGEDGQGVKRLQEALNNAGIKVDGKPLPTTGHFGDMTEQAVKQYQQQKGLEVDGKAGKDTLTALGINPGQQQNTPQPAPTHPDTNSKPTNTPTPTQSAPATNTPAPASTTEPKPTQTQGAGAISDDLLKQGMKGDEVRKLQEALNKNGAKLETDGNFGSATKAAVESYQRSHNLDADGIAGPKTLAALSTQQQAQTLANAQTTPTNTQTTPTEKPQTAANTQTTPTEKPQAPPSSNTTVPQPTQTDKPLMSNPNHPDNKLYQQAVSNLEQLGPGGGFKSRDDLEKAAAAVAADAKATGLKEIDHISKTNAPNGQTYLVAVQGDPTSPASKNAYIDFNQAASQTVAQSTQMAEAQKPAVQLAQVDQAQNQQEQRTARSQ